MERIAFLFGQFVPFFQSIGVSDWQVFYSSQSENRSLF